MNPYCYKCTSEESLSIKARTRSGEVRLWLCKPCRNEQTKTTKPKEPKEVIDIDWIMLAKESHARVLARFSHAN